MREHAQPAFFRLLAAAALACLGCSDATGSPQGGQYLLASDGGSSAATGDGGPSWQDLYTSYFGPTASTSCGGSACHGTGGAGSGFWTCGASATTCWEGITTFYVPKGGATDGTTTGLYMSLRKDGCTAAATSCNMPLTSAFVFSAADLARITAWIQAGAPYN